jgi:hypothetical protein
MENPELEYSEQPSHEELLKTAIHHLVQSALFFKEAQFDKTATTIISQAEAMVIQLDELFNNESEKDFDIDYDTILNEILGSDEV